MIGIGFLLLGTDAACADYVFAPIASGKQDPYPLTVNAGESFSVDLMLEWTDADTPHINTSAIFTVEFSKPGIKLDGFHWSDPYETNGIDDWSEPGFAHLPMLITDASHENPSRPSVVDLYFENFAAVDEFSTGRLLTLDLTIPVGFPPGQLAITAVPDTFDDGFDSIPSHGSQLTVSIVPEPSGLLLLISVVVFPPATVRRRYQ